jgi:hypothetical protein
MYQIKHNGVNMASTRRIQDQLPDFYRKISGPGTQENIDHHKLPPKPEQTEFAEWKVEPIIKENYIPCPIKVSA